MSYLNLMVINYVWIIIEEPTAPESGIVHGNGQQEHNERKPRQPLGTCSRLGHTD